MNKVMVFCEFKTKSIAEVLEVGVGSELVKRSFEYNTAALFHKARIDGLSAFDFKRIPVAELVVS